MTKKRLIFAHIPKTAGTSVRFHLKDTLSGILDTYTEIGVYDMKGWPNPIPGGCAPSEFKAHTLPRDWDFLYGHVTIQQILSNPEIDREDENILLLSFVRDPVDRLLSEYNYIATTKNHPQHKECIATPALEFLARMCQQSLNIQYRYLNCDQNVKWNFIVATNKNVPESCKSAFEKTTGVEIDAGRFKERLNVTKDFKEIGRASKLTVENIPKDQLDDIRKLNHLDVELFESVKVKGIVTDNPAWGVSVQRGPHPKGRSQQGVDVQ